MVLTCPSCAVRYRLPAQLQGGGRATCPRWAARFTAVPPNRAHTPPLPGQPRVVEMSASEQTAERTLPPDAMAMIQLWEDASAPDDEEETVEPDAEALAAARASTGSTRGVFLRQEPVPAEPQAVVPPPIQARPYVPPAPAARPSPTPPSERSASMNRPRIRPEPDPKMLAEQLVMDTMISARPAVAVAPAAPGLMTWAALAALVLMCGGAGAVLANRLTAPLPATIGVPVAPAVATALPLPAAPSVETAPDSEPVPVTAPAAVQPSAVAPPAKPRSTAPAARPPPPPAAEPVRTAPRPVAAPAPPPAEPAPVVEPAPVQAAAPDLEVRTSDLKNPFGN